ncbi:hypothetical protein, conserved [Eimeria praecox]|uniref:Uncharacterized protein n=1 Tax=Eimeria praecox TaxID=51316 RepID=U6H5K6_9EIME|nr:hypothetical protein, conserved [Eimeria praecox]
MAKPIQKNIVLHNFLEDKSMALSEGPSVKGYRIADMEEEDEASFVQGGERDMWVGLLDQEFMMQSSHAFVHVFKKEKPESAARLLAKESLTRVFPMRTRLLGSGRQSYQKHLAALTQALQQAKAGTLALELITASRTLPLYTWSDSLFRHPLMTLQNTIIHGFEEAIGGVSGLFTSEVRSSCFSFAYRVNSVAPYTVVYPGGILGSIMKGLVRSYFLVFQQSLINFKGVFALLIGMRGDPIGQGLMNRLFKREAVVLTTILFQMHAVDVKQQYAEAEEIKSALSGAGGSWALAEGLFIGGAEFGRAFFDLVRKYRRSAEAYVQACEALQNGSLGRNGGRQENVGASPQNKSSSVDPNVETLIDNALEFFEEAHPELSGGDEPLTTEQKLKLLMQSCRKNRRFVETYEKKQYYYIKRVIIQMVTVLQYYFKYFRSYISDILSIFYESAVAMLETKVTESVGAAEGSNSPADEMVASEARHAARRSAAQSATEESQLPRKLFRAPKFAEEATKLAKGFFAGTGALALFQIANDESAEAKALRDVALRLLTTADGEMRKGLGEIYSRFLNSQVLLARVEKQQERIRVFDLISKCQTPLEEKTEEEKQFCGTMVTSEIDPDEFIAKAMVALNLPISSPEDDIAFHSSGDVTRVFEAWANYAVSKRQTRVAKTARLAAETGASIIFLAHMRRAVFDKLVFRRFDHVEGTATLVLYDESGRSLTFTGDDETSVKNLVAPSRDASGKSKCK